jgi:hypothetical protein
VERLEAEWVPGVPTLYLGKADTLRGRVEELITFSRERGKNVRHWGGRLLWQVQGHPAFLVAWVVEPYFAALETDLLDEFIDAHKRLPFANLKRGDRNVPRPQHGPLAEGYRPS